MNDDNFVGDPQIEKDMEAILATVKEELCVEIIWSAMQSLQANPKQTIEQAIDYGWEEWDK